MPNDKPRGYLHINGRLIYDFLKHGTTRSKVEIFIYMCKQTSSLNHVYLYSCAL